MMLPSPYFTVGMLLASWVVVYLDTAAMDWRTVFVVLWMLLPYPSTAIKLDGGGYVDITIAIGAKVKQDDTLIDKIKEMVTDGSFYLYHALDKKVYLKDATILVPSHWSCKSCSKARTESFEKAKIKIDHAKLMEPRTKLYGECGKGGEYIHFTPDFLLNDSAIQMYGPRGKVFLHEWAHLRWGVYDEYNEEKPFYLSNGRVEYTRCTTNIEGQIFEVNGGSPQSCRINPETFLPSSDCKFFPNKDQNTDSSVMFSPSLEAVTTFCRETEHNYEAETQQNIICNNKATWTVIFEDSVDKDALSFLPPLPSTPSPPIFKLLQRKKRAVCLILDVSGSMATESRILRMRQAATHLLRNYVEEQASVGIVKFSTAASIVSSLTIIESDATRDHLINLLPETPGGSTNMCNGLRLGLQVLSEDDMDAIGDEIIFLTDGQATDDVTLCIPDAINSGAIIHTIALSDSAHNALQEMADKTGGIFFYSKDDFTSNQLMDAFASLTLSTGDHSNEPVQLESVGTRTSDWFNGTVSVDQTVGNKTSFVIIYERIFPAVYIQSPSGIVYTEAQMNHDNRLKTVTLKVAETAEPGDWAYSIKTSTDQAFTITVTSQASHEDVPPIIVKTRMNQQVSDGTKPMTVFAEVSQNYRPVINVEVWATLEPATGPIQSLQLLDNGAGADVMANDGIYSRYFTKMVNGRCSLKVRAKNQDGKARFAVQKRSGAPYVPGYVVDGVVELNPPNPSVSDEPIEVGSFTRTATGESFEVTLTGSTPPNFPPSKVTDLGAKILEEAVLLSWTAPGEDLDQGRAKSYEIRWSFDLDMLRQDFSNGHVVDTATVSPQEAGSVEQHAFNLSLPIQNGTTLFFAVQTLDEHDAKSDTSNIASASMILPNPKPPGISNPGLNLTVLVSSLCAVTIVICIIAGVTTWAVRRRRPALRI
ncbi:calcium-activated chloride channel regulator 1 isoform X2 [Danio rerio]|uniref:Calcium-activated chloride channel regulator 1 isoform X2 n=1 Tax=Danio rerio TaxID=7955 RepID=A0AC58HA81_DANRE